MNPTQAENLRILIRHMETKVARRLYMERYFDTDENLCRTPACAMGEAAFCDELAHLGIDRSGMFLRTTYGHHFVSGSENVERLFGPKLTNAFQRADVTPHQWAAEARKVLAEHGYSMDDGFAAFRAKIMKPLDVSVTTEHGTALFPK